VKVAYGQTDGYLFPGIFRVSISVSACAIPSILLEVSRYSDFWGLGVLVQTIAKSLKKGGGSTGTKPSARIARFLTKHQSANLRTALIRRAIARP
jgi:hypothetical protein